MAPSQNGSDLLRVLREEGLVGAADLERAVGAGGTDVALDLLVAEEFLTRDQVRRMKRWHAKVVMTCFLCIKRTAIDAATWNGQFFCEYCYKTVGLAERTCGFDDQLLLNPIDKLLDDLIMRRLVKGERLSAESLDQARAARLLEIPRPPLRRVVVALGLIDPAAMVAEEAHVSQGLRNKFGAVDRLTRDYDLARFLLSRRLVSHEGVASALHRQRDEAAHGRYTPLREELGKTGELTEFQRQTWLPERFDQVGEDELVIRRVPDTLPAESLEAFSATPDPVVPGAGGQAAEDVEPAADPVPEPEPPAAPEDEPEVNPIDSVDLSVVPATAKRATPHGTRLRISGRPRTPRMELKVQRLSETAQMPILDPESVDAGIDLHSDEQVTLDPGQVHALATGIATCFPPGFVGIVKDRSGMASRGIHALGGVIDSGYRGEWKVLLVNLGQEPYTVERGDRIAQAVFHTLPRITMVEAQELPDSDRGDSGFGSTGR